MAESSQGRVVWRMEEEMTALTARQTEVLEYIRRFIVREGWPPTTRELATYFGVNQTAALGYLERLEDKKAISRQPKCARAIKIL